MRPLSSCKMTVPAPPARLPGGPNRCCPHSRSPCVHQQGAACQPTAVPARASMPSCPAQDTGRWVLLVACGVTRVTEGEKLSTLCSGSDFTICYRLLNPGSEGKARKRRLEVCVCTRFKHCSRDFRCFPMERLSHMVGARVGSGVRLPGFSPCITPFPGSEHLDCHLCSLHVQWEQ